MAAALARPRIARDLVAREARRTQHALGGLHVVSLGVVGGPGQLARLAHALHGRPWLDHERVAAHVAHAERHGLGKRALPALTRLVRDAAHEVERDAQAARNRRGDPIARESRVMDAPEAPELTVVEALDADGDAGGPGLARRREHLVGERLGIGLERELGGRADAADEGGQGLGPEHRGRAAADVGRLEPVNKLKLACLADEALEGGPVAGHEGVPVPRGGRREVAVAAAPHAERDVKVERAGHQAEASHASGASEASSSSARAR